MKKLLIAAALVAAPALSQEEPQGQPSPNEIVAQAAPSEWVAIPAQDLLVMTLAPDRDGKPRRAVIQLIPPPFSQPWVANIRTLAKAHWWDGLGIVRVQDNYVVQWGDPEAEDEAQARALPEGLVATSDDDYTQVAEILLRETPVPSSKRRKSGTTTASAREKDLDLVATGVVVRADPYAQFSKFRAGWPTGNALDEISVHTWPVHCYGMVGVGRGYSPDAGSGAELYTVIGHAPRHLDRNIALVGRVIEGIEHLSSLPRGTGPLGFYETAEERVPIESIRLASELPSAEQPVFEYLSTERETFARYAESRANRRDPFFIVPAGGADICNIPVPLRRVAQAD